MQTFERWGELQNADKVHAKFSGFGSEFPLAADSYGGRLRVNLAPSKHAMG